MNNKRSRTTLSRCIKRIAQPTNTRFILHTALRMRSGCKCPSAFSLDENGFALVWWALVISFAAFPLLVFVIEGARYLQASGAVQKAADAAAEAAVREIDVAHYIATGTIMFSGGEYAVADQYANANAQFLHARQIRIEILSIAVDEAQNTVQVTARADVTALFPAIAPSIILQRAGTAQVRLTAQ